MRQHYLFFFIVAALLAGGCSSRDKNFTLRGTIEHMPKHIVYLEELSINNNIITVDSAHSDANGSFEMSGHSTEPGLYRIRFQGDQFILLSMDKGTTKITGDWNNLTDYKVIGSASSASLQGFLGHIRSSLKDFNTLSIVIDSMRARGNDSMLQKANADLETMNFKLTRFVEQYSDTTAYLPNAIFAVSMLNAATETEYLKTFTQSLLTRFPNSAVAKDFVAKINEAASPSSNSNAGGSNIIGSPAPEIDLPTPSGKNISLSSLKGKYVLVDFWASWCGPCRAENPNVVAAFQKYKAKNFTILGVSLDNDKAKWQQAIKDDNLMWHQVSDLQGWESVAARTYGVQSIPSNFLVDPDGKIIATNLRGSSLDAALGEALK